MSSLSFRNKAVVIAAKNYRQTKNIKVFWSFPALLDLITLPNHTLIFSGIMFWFSRFRLGYL